MNAQPNVVNVEFPMRLPQRAVPKKLDYPEETPGSRLAAKARKLANKLTPEQRREHFNKAMTMKRFVPPTLEEATIHGSQIGLPQVECERFWFFYDSKGWKVGKTPMQRWKSALAGWKLRSQERNEKPSADVSAILNQKALERVEERLKYLRGQFPLTQPKHKTEWNELSAERRMLMQKLGFKA